MKAIEWLIAITLIIIGVFCLTMAGSWMFYPDSFRHYFSTLLHICFWLVLPMVIAVLTYYLLRKKNQEKNDAM